MPQRPGGERQGGGRRPTSGRYRCLVGWPQRPPPVQVDIQWRRAVPASLVDDGPPSPGFGRALGQLARIVIAVTAFRVAPLPGCCLTRVWTLTGPRGGGVRAAAL